MINAPVQYDPALNQMMVQLPEEFKQTLMKNFGGMTNLGGAMFPRLSVKGYQFTLVKGDSKEILSTDYLDIIILGMAPNIHYMWYKDAYNDNKESVAPTAQWLKDSPPPANVPSWVMTTKRPDGYRFFSEKLRIAACFFRRRRDPATGQEIIDLDRSPVAIDIGAQSLYSAGIQIPAPGGGIVNAVNFVALKDFCVQNAMLPMQFMTRMVFDRVQSTVTCKFVVTDAQGQIQQITDPGYLQAIFQIASSAEVANILRIDRIGDGEVEDVEQSQPVQPPVQPPIQALIQPPIQPAAPAAYATSEASQPAPIQSPQGQPSVDNLLERARAASANVAATRAQPSDPTAAAAPTGHVAGGMPGLLNSIKAL